MLALLGSGPGCDDKQNPEEPGRVEKRVLKPSLDRPTVLLIVLDTVRRDRTTVCGYTRPTTPNLAKLAARGTTFCRMVTPGSWTLPVHASIFTGRYPQAHGADFIPRGISVPGFSHLSMSAMRNDLPTLAGLFKQAGYQTAMLSTNPVLHPAVGLARDFEHVRVYKRFIPGKAGAAYHEVARLTANLDPKKPLFMFVNISLAHSPYEKVPANIDWTTATDEIMSPYKDGLFVRYVTGKMTAAEAEPVLKKLSSAYDWGVRLADRDLGRTLGALAGRGWLNDDSIVAVTSDHGELLGEHRLLDHGRTVVRENIDVFAVIQAPGFEAESRDDHLVQSQDLFPTLLEAAGIEAPASTSAVALQTPEEKRIAITVNQPDPHWTKITGGIAGARHLVAVQRGIRRVIWSSPDTLVGEKVAGLQPVTEKTESLPGLSRTARELSRAVVAFTGEAVELPEETVESLRSLGYVQ